MAFNLADQYFVKALEVYDYDLEEVVENLNYALSYDPEHSGANELMGRMYMDQFNDFEKARSYLNDAIASNLSNILACESLTRLHIKLEEYDEALRLIKYATELPGTRKDRWIRMKGLVFELKKEYAGALKLLEVAMELSVDSGYIYFIQNEICRIKAKQRNALTINYHYNE